MAKRNPKKFLGGLKGDWTVAEISIHYKPNTLNSYSITSCDDLYRLIRKLWDEERINLQEQFMALFFNINHKLIGYRLISTGSMKTCVVDIKLLVSLALHTLAEHVVIAHSHPSGNLSRSRIDDAINVKIKEALALIDVNLLDHLIITSNGYFSFVNEGLL